VFKLALPVDGCRTGRLGQLPVDADYMADVKARARMLARACRLTDGEPPPQPEQAEAPVAANVNKKEDQE